VIEHLTDYRRYVIEATDWEQRVAAKHHLCAELREQLSNDDPIVRVDPITSQRLDHHDVSRRYVSPKSLGPSRT